MTTQQQSQAIREACIAANPSINDEQIYIKELREFIQQKDTLYAQSD